MDTTTVREPTHREALWELESAFDRGALVTVFGRCTVEYDGRAASSLSAGQRLLVLKPDGTALVHTDEGREPVNWQPPGCEHRAAVRDGHLRVASVRSSPDEQLTVVFSRVGQLSAYPVTGRRDVTVTGTEADLRDRLMADPSLIEPGFEPVATERDTTAGAVDLFGTDADDSPVVVELKRRRVGPEAVGQLDRYVRAIDREDSTTPAPRGILAAPSLTDRARRLLEREELEFVAVEPPDEAVLDTAQPNEPTDGSADEPTGDSTNDSADEQTDDSTAEQTADEQTDDSADEQAADSTGEQSDDSTPDQTGDVTAE